MTWPSAFSASHSGVISMPDIDTHVAYAIGIVHHVVAYLHLSNLNVDIFGVDIKRIYAKLNVHSQQKLIDLVEKG